jgi:hypothetical protein
MENRSLFPLALYLVNEDRERAFRAAAQRRLVAAKPRRSLRLAVGQSLVRVGERLVGEPNLELARSR